MTQAVHRSLLPGPAEMLETPVGVMPRKGTKDLRHARKYKSGTRHEEELP